MPSCTAIPDRVPEDEDPAEDRPAAVAHAIGHIDDRAEDPSTRDSNCVNEISADFEGGKERRRVRARGMIGSFTDHTPLLQNQNHTLITSGNST
jgi:hypothetical protein